ncbi:NADPH-dependent diflavin oxidoreductase 1-like [Ornithodoros turicata]|uniref:NADPH-dependent diflavin oxidoreductase 1-like n=1 Tax=Ornithodoros turicata TaxID=34597 RepID=UPI00313A386B
MRATRLLILYGSQTGTAEDVASRISRCGKRRMFHVTLLSMDDYPVSELITEELVLFVCATTGQGEEPDNMKSFWTFLLRRTLPSNSLASMLYGVIGLGDSSYLKFNFTAKRLHRRLTQLGAKALAEPVYADDQHELGPDGMIDPWLENFWNILESKYPLPVGQTTLSDDILEASMYQLEQQQTASSTCIVNHRAFLSPVLENRRMTSVTHFQDVRLLRFSTKGSCIHFEPGDVVMVQPDNMQEDVSQFLHLFHLDPNVVWRLKSSSVLLPPLLSEPITVQTCAEKYFHLSYIPKRSFFQVFWHFADDDLEREKLRELSTAAGQEDLVDYVIRPRRTVLEVFADFPHTTSRVPWNYLFDLIPPIRPRPFSIANSLRSHPDEIHILVAIVEFETKLLKPRRGLCSTFLARLQENTQVPLWVRRGSLRLAPDNAPVLMVGPGTGCAPFRGIIQDRCIRNIPENILFYGSRNKAGDFFFQEEWNKLVERGQLDLVTAFSRDQDHKIYVQHRISQEKEKVLSSVAKGGTVYIAGNAKDMVPAVRLTLKAILQDLAGPDEDGETVLKRLERLHRLQIEAWS